MEDPVHEADARALIGVLIGQLDVDLPQATLEGCCIWSAMFKTYNNAVTYSLQGP